MHYQVDSAEFVREVCDNNLLADQGEQLAFAHEMYQEYFAACGLKRAVTKPILSVVEPLLGQPSLAGAAGVAVRACYKVAADNLFQRIVRDEPAVAAECLAQCRTDPRRTNVGAAAAANSARRGLSRRASDKELGKKFWKRSTCSRRWFELLAYHLCQERRQIQSAIEGHRSGSSGGVQLATKSGTTRYAGCFGSI
jgi:hypothetical protein